MKQTSTDGSSQGRRLPAALESDYFLPFEMSFPHCVALLRDVAGSVAFHSADDQHKTWGHVLDQSSVVQLSRLFILDSAYYEKIFEDAVLNGLDVAAEFTEQLATEVLNWLDLVESVTSAAQAESVHSQIQKLGLSTESSKQTLSTPENYTDNVVQLRTNFEDLMASLHDVRKQVLPYVEHSLKSGNTDPSLGLLFVFLQLLIKLQSHANQFTSRHTDYLYKNLLGAKPLAGTADRTFVSFAPSPDIEELLINKKTRLDNGIDSNGQEIRYSTNSNLLINSAWVSSVCTLHMERDILVSPESDLGYVSRLYSQKTEYEKHEIQDIPTIPVFGAYQSTDKRTNRRDGEVGFAIASDLLLTQNSNRIFTLSIEGETEFESDAGVQGALFQLQEELIAAQRSKDPKNEYDASENLLIKRILKSFLSNEMLLGDIPTAQELAAETLRRMSTQSDPLVQVVKICDGDINRLHRDLLLSMVLESQDANSYKNRLGRIVAPYLLGRTGWLTPSVRKKLLDHGCDLIPEWKKHCIDPIKRNEDDRVFNEQILGLLCGTANDENGEHVLHFYHLFRKLFTIAVTTEDGWFDVDNWTITPERSRTGVKLVISFTLQRSDPSVTVFDSSVHHGHYQCESPVCRLIVNQNSSFFAYSPLSGVLLSRLDLSLNCRGVTDLVVHTESGQIDHTKPFPVFGPLVGVGSYLVLGVQEAEYKPVNHVEIELKWFNLPDLVDGFASYFKAYPEQVTNEQFIVRLEYLQDGEWREVSGNASAQLFGPSDKLAETVVFKFDIDSNERYHGHSNDSVMEFGPRSQSGFYRLVLAGPQQAFGANAYPSAFSAISLENAKRRLRKPLKLPQQPYSVTCQRVSANYQAMQSLNLVQPEGAGVARPMRFFHIHPFGVLQIPLEKSYLKRSLVPEYAFDGNLMIGISRTKSIKNINIYFELEEKKSRDQDDLITGINWFYLTEEGWARLTKENILEDSTESFNRSGIVSIILPEDIVESNPLMPQGRFWLRVSASHNLSSFGKINKIATHAVQVTRDSTANAPKVSNNKWSLASNISGVLDIQPLGTYLAQRTAESDTEFRTRLSERLRHKGRALLPWDYERLILSEFPDVFKCKCIKGNRLDGKDSQPGRVLLVAMAVDPTPQKMGVRSIPQLSSIRLFEIQTMLMEKAPPNINIEIVNPIVERLQVRCSVMFKEQSRSGEYRERLNTDISQYLWPWLSFGYSAQFDWVVRLGDVKQYIKKLDYVSYITEFSMLKLTENSNDRFQLTDLARESKPIINASFHGSIALPMENHFIHVINKPISAAAKEVGVDELKLNSTFVVGERSNAHV